MTDLGDKAQALVDAARLLDDPTHSDRARVRSRLAATLGGSVALSSATKASAAAAKSGGLWGASAALGAKVVSPVVIAVALSVAAGVVVWREGGFEPAGVVGSHVLDGPAGRRGGRMTAAASKSTPAPAPAITDAMALRPPAVVPEIARRAGVWRTRTLQRARESSLPRSGNPAAANSGRSAVPRAAATTESPGAARAAEVDPTQAAETLSPVSGPAAPALEQDRAVTPAPAIAAIDAPPPAANTAEAAAPPAHPTARPPTAPAAAPDLADELRLLSGAQRAIRAEQYGQALKLLDQHAARHAAGSLVPERLAARAVALCRAHRASAGLSELQLLETRAPDSPLLQWARTNCAVPRRR